MFRNLAQNRANEGAGSAFLSPCVIEGVAARLTTRPKRSIPV